MKKNIGSGDRILRFIFGIFLLLFAWWQTSWITLAFAAFIFYEVLTSWCIFYQFIGKNSCQTNLIAKIKKEESIDNKPD